MIIPGNPIYTVDNQHREEERRAEETQNRICSLQEQLLTEQLRQAKLTTELLERQVNLIQDK